MRADHPITQGLLHPRWIVSAALLLLSALAWVLLMQDPAGLGCLTPLGQTPHDVHGPLAQPSSLSHFLTALSMWFLMSIAMMLPTAAPAILTFSDLAERARHTARPLSEGAFVMGYLMAWLAFDLLACSAQLALALASSRLHSATHALAFGCLLVLAGMYQFAPLKQACLTKCRNPMTFFLAHWREGTIGALRLGLHHGAYCVGCCWALMFLMVATGTMNLGLTAGLAVLMLAEKVLPGGLWIGRIVGVGLMAWGILWIAPGLIY